MRADVRVKECVRADVIPHGGDECDTSSSSVAGANRLNSHSGRMHALEEEKQNDSSDKSQTRNMYECYDVCNRTAVSTLTTNGIVS